MVLVWCPSQGEAVQLRQGPYASYFGIVQENNGTGYRVMLERDGQMVWFPLTWLQPVKDMSDWGGWSYPGDMEVHGA